MYKVTMYKTYGTLVAEQYFEEEGKAVFHAKQWKIDFPDYKISLKRI